MPEVDAPEQHRKLLAPQFHRRARVGPGEGAPLESLREDAETRAVPEQDFHQMPPAIAEDEDVAGERILADHPGRRRGQPVEETERWLRPNLSYEP